MNVVWSSSKLKDTLPTLFCCFHAANDVIEWFFFLALVASNSQRHMRKDWQWKKSSNNNNIKSKKCIFWPNPFAVNGCESALTLMETRFGKIYNCNFNSAVNRSTRDSPFQKTDEKKLRTNSACERIGAMNWHFAMNYFTYLRRTLQVHTLYEKSTLFCVHSQIVLNK